jgi:hypothetical protein
MVGIDLLANRHARSRGDAQIGAGAAQGLGECQRSATVQQAKWLPGATIHRHSPAHEILADLQDLDAQ